MNSKLCCEQDWLELARRANWSVTNMANYFKVSVRTLERHFVKNTGLTPRIWITQQRRLEALALIREGYTVKETAATLGYKFAGNLTRSIKSRCAVSPSLSPQNKILPPQMS